jgi:DNA invertase Pin-like site-specific DNA recombinase
MQDTDSQACAIDKFIAEKFEPHCKFTVFEDLAKSGKDENRPAFRRLIAAIEAKEVTAVIVYRLDRLSRSSLSALRLLIDWIQRGVSFYAVDQPILQLGPENPFRLTFAAMMAEIAQIERETLISRIKSGIECQT